MKIFGIIGLLATAWLAGSLAIMIGVGVVHAWWAPVPTMPYGVALALGAIKMLAAMVGAALAEVVKHGLAESR